MFLKFGERHAGDWFVGTAIPFQSFVMDSNDLPIGREIDIDFDGIGLLLPGELDRCQGVFRGVVGRAAMRDDFHVPRDRDR